MNYWKNFIDNIIQSCCQFISERSTFECIKDPQISSLLLNRLLSQEKLREDLTELMLEYVRKFYGSNVFFIDESNLDLDILRSLSKRLMDGFYTYSNDSLVDREFRVHINYMICSVAFHILKN